MKNFLLFKFNTKRFTILFFGFILFTIIGTVTHEIGHYSFAKTMGYHAEINYYSTYWEDKSTSSFMDSAYANYSKEIENNLNFPRKTEFNKINTKLIRDSFWITWGGPLQTMITGTFGLVLILFQRKKIIATQKLNFFQWLCIFLSLFWLRPLANLFTWILGYFINGSFRTNGDEIILAEYLKLPIGTLAIFFATIGLAVLIYIVFKIVPIANRFTFLLAGFFGGIVGYLFWLVYFGKYIMP